MFQEESSQEVPFGSQSDSVNVSVYKHDHSDLRLVFVPLSGPLW